MLLDPDENITHIYRYFVKILFFCTRCGHSLVKWHFLSSCDGLPEPVWYFGDMPHSKVVERETRLTPRWEKRCGSDCVVIKPVAHCNFGAIYDCDVCKRTRSATHAHFVLFLCQSGGLRCIQITYPFLCTVVVCCTVVASTLFMHSNA